MDIESRRKRIINKEILCRSPGEMSIFVQTGDIVQSDIRDESDRSGKQQQYDKSEI